MNVTFGAYYTLIMAVLVLLLGKFMTRHIRFLRDFNIPEPVSGGGGCRHHLRPASDHGADREL